MTPDTPLRSSNELADDRTRLALTRTIVALDRTLMAWVRTAVSLISFGFTIYKFFQGQPPQPDRILTPRVYALVMMGIGVGALAVATYEYRKQLSDFHAQYPSYGPFSRSLAATVAGVIAGFGIIGFVLVFLRQ